MEKFDLCVIGGGPAGYAAAMRAVDYGKKVLLIEKDKVGGAGIYNGALSSKTLWELSEKVYAVNKTIVSTGRKEFQISWEEVRRTMNEAIFDRKFQYSCHIKLLQTEASKQLFFYERGFGTMLDRYHVQIKKETGETKVIKTDYIILATGSRPRKLSNIPIDEKIIMTSDGIHHIDDYPKSLVILGAGVIGCEFATIFSNFGRTKVNIIDKADRILPFEDEDIAELIASNMRDKDVTIHGKAQLIRMDIVDGQVEYEIEKEGKRETIRVEKALVSVGRVPNIEGLGLENAGVKMSKRGIHIGDDDTQTNIPNIYAVGDVSGRIALVNMGEIEARHAVEKIFGGKTERLSYDNVSTIMFLHPEVASVGLNEQTCRQKNIPVRVVKIDYSCIARAIAMRKTQGFFKIITTDDKNMRILGMRAVGEHASSAIEAVALLIKMNKGIEELAELVHPHPSIVEGVQEALRMLLNKSIFKSSVFKDKLKCYSCRDGVCTPLQRL
ncbi:MAG: NAD(P)/FAD-dependent oxidoreductase [Bacteroidetes bacterium]|nr:MAG: NAD(P)/FAD-dependent oxidoreductase [Bacteroidota bacterium]